MKNSILTFRNKIIYLDYVVNDSMGLARDRRMTGIIIPITFSILPDCIIKTYGSLYGNNYNFIIESRSFVCDNDRKRRGNIINFLKNKIKIENIFIDIFQDNYYPIEERSMLLEKEEYISSDECKKLLSDFYDLISDMNAKSLTPWKQNLALTVIKEWR